MIKKLFLAFVYIECGHNRQFTCLVRSDVHIRLVAGSSPAGGVDTYIVRGSFTLSKNQTIQESFSIGTNILTDVLGSNLTENLSIVFAEQIKNAKDAKATHVVIDLSQFDSGIIEIRDNGLGIESTNIKNTWFFAGTQIKADDTRMLGGKGIGRFTMFALGSKIKVETIANHIQSSFTLDKKELDKKNRLNEITIPVETIQTTKESGTRIYITNLVPEVIDNFQIEDDLHNLFIGDSEFSVDIIPTDPSAKKTFKKFSEAVKDATLRSAFSLNWSSNRTPIITYNSYAQLTDKNKLITTQASKDLREYIKTNKNLLSKIGNISVQIYHFYFPGKIGKDFPYLKKIRKDASSRSSNFLKYDSGVNLYRNDFKIFGYGKNDWLNLNEYSYNRTIEIANSRIVARIILDVKSASTLEEKSSREGLKTNTKLFHAFKNLIWHLILQVNADHETAKELLKQISLEVQKSPNPTEKGPTESDSNTTFNGDNTQSTNNLKTSDNNSHGDNSNTENNHETKIHPKIKLKNNNKSIHCHENCNLYKFIDLKNSISSSGTSYTESDLEFYRDGTLVENGNLLPFDVSQKINIVVQDINNSNIASSFELNIIDSKKSNTTGRNELFPLNIDNKYYKLASSNPNDFFNTIMKQLNSLWINGEYDYVVYTAMRSIADVEIEARLRPNIVKITDGKYKLTLGGGLKAIKSLVEKIINDSTLQKECAQCLSLNKDTKENFFRTFKNPNDTNASGESFMEKIKIAHTGAHNPLSAPGPLDIQELASNITKLLELSEAYIKISTPRE